MRYFGGKARIAKQIANYLNNVRKPNQVYLEPFVGGGWILSNINTGPNKAFDICKPLISLWNKLLCGWIPPDVVTKEDYYKAKNGELSDELTAFIGFGCSFAGKWFGGYASTEGRNYALNAKNSLLKKIKNINKVTEFFCSDYKNIISNDCLIYCDPPYEGTTKYDYCKSFDYKEFWDIMRLWSKNNTVIISEYKAPKDFEIVLEISTKTDIRNKNCDREVRIERLFKYKGSV